MKNRAGPAVAATGVFLYAASVELEEDRLKIGSLYRAAGIALSCLAFAAAGRAQAPIAAASAAVLEFASQQGSSTIPLAQRIMVRSVPGNLPFTATSTPGTNWLLLNGTQNSTSGNTASSPYIQVQPLPGSLAPGSYTSNITIVVQGVAAPINVTINYFVSTSPVVVAQPSELLDLTVPAGSAFISTVVVSSSGTAIPFSATAYTLTGAGWLSVTPASANTPSSISITANATALQPGFYVGVISLGIGTPGNFRVTIPVALTVPGAAATPQVQVSPSSVNLAYQPGFQAPLQRAITVSTDSATPVQYTAILAGDTSFVKLSASSSGPGADNLTQTTGSPLFLITNPSQTPGTYNAELSITLLTPGSTPVKVPIKLVVANAPLLTSTPDSLMFNYQVGTPPPGAQTITIQSTSGLLPFTASVPVAAPNSTDDYLTVAQTTSTNISVGLNATRIAQLPAGTYQSRVTITSAGAQNSPYIIPVTLNVSGSAFVAITPANLDFGSVLLDGPAPATQSFQVTSTDATVQSFQVNATVPWISLPAAGATLPTPQTVTVGLRPSFLPTTGGPITTNITVTPIVNNMPGTPRQLPVNVNVLLPNTTTANPARLTFTQVADGPAPVGQTVTLTSTVQGVAVNAASDQSWLIVSPVTGNSTSATFTVSVNGKGLPVGQQTGNVIVNVPGATDLRIPVTLNIQSTATLAVAPATLSFNSLVGSAAPPAQTVALSSNGVAISFTAAAATTTGGNWLTVTPASGATGAMGAPAVNVTVSANPAGLQPGTYNGSVTLTGTNAANPAVVVPVTFTVSNAVPPLIQSINNAATNAPTSVAPGLILAIKGSNLGPTTGVQPTGADAGTIIGSTLGEVRILFDGQPAPILFARQDQVNVVAPYSLFGRTTTRITAEYRGIASQPLDVQVVNTAPGIFSLDASGRGQGAILNQDNTVNGINNPAAAGSFISIYATGEGQTNPQGVTGQVIRPAVNDLRRPLGQVTVRFNNVAVPAGNVPYAGSAPGLVSGAFQINVRVPTGLPANTPIPIDVRVGSAMSQQGLTVVVRPAN